MDTSVMEGVLEEEAKEKHANKYHKYRHLVTHYVAKQYLLALIKFSPQKNDQQQQELLEDKEARHIDDSGTRIATIKGITEALINLPREFQQWNKNYNSKSNAISPQENLKHHHHTVKTHGRKESQEGNFTASKQLKEPRPFDISKSIDESFKSALLIEKDPDEVLPLQLPKDWDPSIAAVGLARNTIVNMFREPIQSYKNGQEKGNTKRHKEPTITNSDKK